MTKPKVDPEDQIVTTLRDLIRERSQSEVAAQLGISRSYLSELATGKKRPGPLLLRKLGYDPMPHYRRLP